MEDTIPKPPPRPLPEPNPVTRKAHRREAFWQITFPFLIALLLILLLAGGTIWAAAGGMSEVSRWADVSLIWLLAPQLVFLMIPLVLLSGLVYLVGKLLLMLPRYTRLVQDFLALVRQRVREYADKMVEPVLRLHGYKASADAFRHGVSRVIQVWKGKSYG